MSRRYVIASVAALCLALVACQATSDPPIAEWSVEPSNAPHDPARAGGGGGRSAALTSARGSGAVVLPGNGRFIGSGRGGKPEAPEPGEEDVTLNLANLPIAQAVKVVLGDILGANYVVDPRLDGKITVHTTKPVTKAAALELFQSALRLSGAAVVQAGGVYKVVPLDQAATAGADISTSANDSPSHSAAEGVRIIQLHYVAPSEIRRLLEPMTAQGTVLQADDNRHTITLKGTPQDVASLEDVIATFDIDTMRGMSFALVPVKSGDPDTMAEDLRKVFGSDDKEGPMKDMVRFVSNKRLQSILVISAQRAYLERAQAWIQRLDARAQGTEKQFFTYRVQNRPAKEMLQVLSSMFGEGSKGSDGNTAPRFGQSSSSSGSDSSALGSSSAGSSSPLGALSASGPTGGAGGLGGGAGGLGGAGGSASPGGAGGMGGQVGGPGGSPGFFGSAGNGPNDQSQSKGPTSVSLGADNRYKVGVDEAKNSLVVMATPEDYKRILHVIEALDVQPNQVFIEATIAEVTLTDELHFGVAWFLQQRSHAAGWGGLGPSAAAAIANNPLGNNNILGNNVVGVPLQSLFPGFSYAFTAASGVVVLNALNAITTVNILSTPSLTVLDNRQATLQVGQEIPVTTLQSVAALGNTFNSVSYLDTGVILAITPHISESGRLMLDIDQQVSNPVPGSGLNAASGNNPTIEQRKVKTQVGVTDGESLVLGGLIQDQRSKTANQIPVLGDFPVVGSAFKDKDDTINKTELIIMITPHVIRSMSEAREIAEEYKRKLLSVSTKAIARPHDIEQSVRRSLLDDTSVSPWLPDKVSR